MILDVGRRQDMEKHSDVALAIKHEAWEALPDSAKELVWQSGGEA